MEGQRDSAAFPSLEPVLTDELRLEELDPGLQEQLNAYDEVNALSQFMGEDERALFPARVALMFGMNMSPIQASQFNQDQAVEHLKTHQRQLDAAKAEIAQRPDLQHEVYEWFGSVGLT